MNEDHGHSSAPREALAHAYNYVKQLEDENEAAKTHDVARDRHVAVLENENANLKTQLKRNKAERDHYFKAFTALSAQLDSLASGLISSIHMARTQAYGERRPRMEPERQLLQPRRSTNGARPDDGEPVPAFLTSGETTDRRPSPVSLDALRRAVDGVTTG
jgi:hypothetical protein